MSLRPTRFGSQALLFHLAMVTAFFASPYSNLYFLLLGFLTLLGLVGGHGALRNLRGVDGAVDTLAPQPAGLPLQATLRVAPGDRVRFQLEGRLELAGGHALVRREPVVGEACHLRLAGPPLPRGCYPVRAACLSSRHPFNLLRVVRAVSAPAELVVYPAPAGAGDADAEHTLLGPLFGAGEPGRGELQPSGLRDHRADDGTRGIHWRASARRGRLVVQEWEGGRCEGVELVLDRRCAPAELEDALSLASALVAACRERKETLRLHSQGHSATYGDGQQPWEELLRFLAAAEPLPPGAPAPPAVSPTVLRLPSTRAA